MSLAKKHLETVVQAEPEQPVGYTMVWDMVKNVRPPQWLIKGHLEADSLALIYGPPKCGKSFLAIDWACCIASGREWKGHRTKTGTVFYIAGEGHAGLSRRFLAWMQTNGVEASRLRIGVTPTAIPLMNLEAAMTVEHTIHRMAEAHGAPSLIVVDTLARNFGGNENATEDMNRFVQHVDQIRRPWNATALVVHHTGKDEASGPRGSVALRGAIDSSYSITRDAAGAVVMEAIDMKDAPPPPSMAFSLKVAELPEIREEDGSPSTSCYLDLLAGYEPVRKSKSSAGKGKNQTRMLEALRKLYREAEARLEGTDREPRIDIETLKEASGLTDRRRFSEARQALEKQGAIRVDHPHVYLT
jgi:KaiC/GvpD/RAD55 family RecA-like ATPase